MIINKISYVFLLIIVLTFCGNNVFSNQSKLDSLGTLIEKLYKDKSNPATLKKMIFEELDFASNVSHTKALELASKRLNIAFELEDDDFINHIYNRIGNTYNNLGQYDLAVQTLYRTIEHFKKVRNHSAVVYIYSDIGNIYYKRGLVIIAADIYKQAIDYAIRIKPQSDKIKNAISVCYLNIGLCKREEGKYYEAKEYFLKNYNIRNELGLSYLKPHSLNYLATVEKYISSPSEAIKILLESIKISEELIKKNKSSKFRYDDVTIYDVSEFLIDAKFDLLTLYDETNDSVNYYKARDELFRLINEVQNYQYLILYHNNLLEHHKKLNNIDSAIISALEMYNIANEKSSITFKIIATRDLIKFFADRRDIDKSLEFLKIYDNMIDTFYNHKFEIASMDFQRKEEIEKSQLEIKEVESAKNNEIRFQTLVRNFAFAFTVIIIIVLIFIYYRYRNNNQLLRFLDSVINSLKYPFYVINYPDKSIHHINETGKKIIKDPTSIFDTGHQLAYTVEDIDLSRIERIAESKNPIIDEKQIDGIEGKSKFYKIYNYPVFDSNHEVVKIIEYVIDVTQSKINDIEREKLISQLQVANFALEEESNKVRELNRILQESENNLKLLNSTKDKFFSIVAHDLRNPISGFKSLMSLISETYSELSEKEKIELIELMKVSADSLMDLLENLLHWSKSQRGLIHVDYTSLDLRYLVNNIIELLLPVAQNKKINLKSEIHNLTIVSGDVNILQTVIRNLVTNALKFTNQGGIVTISYSEDGINNILCVEDTGVGIPQEIQSQLFDIDSNFTTIGTNREKGTGLGLVLCYDLIKKHNGSIWLESKINEGSKFYISFPKR